MPSLTSLVNPGRDGRGHRGRELDVLGQGPWLLQIKHAVVWRQALQFLIHPIIENQHAIESIPIERNVQLGSLDLTRSEEQLHVSMQTRLYHRLGLSAK